MALTPQWLDELRARVTLSSVIMRTTKLQKAGREWKACCPFHNEKTPSFYVNDEKGFYHCFGCQAHGDVIRWMTDQRGLQFMDAVKELAVEAGMEVPAPDPQAAKRAEKRASLHDVTAEAQEWFVDNLRSADGAAARAYLEKRGISKKIAREFGFGYAPDSKQASARALSRFDQSMLVDTGLQISVDGKDPYDRFRGRLMLPIQDMRGRIVGFGGRILDAEANPKAPKYLNSPDTELFDKGRTLYNLNRAASAARQSGRIVVVEGYMDVIALAQAGIGEAVAPMGTALTEMQLELLWRQVERPILCFDGDNAGQRAAMKAIARALPLLRPSHSLSIVRLPAGLDPDDLIKQSGSKAMEKLLESPQSLLDALWQFERDAVPLDSPEAKAGLKARLIEHTEAIENQDIRALYRRELLQRYSDFAFPPRPKKDWGNRDWKGAGKPFNTRPQRLSQQSKARLGAIGSSGGRDDFAQAVLAGLERYPSVLVDHADAMLRWARSEPHAKDRVEKLLEYAESLDLGGDTPISGSNGHLPTPDNPRFTFLVEGHDPETAAQDLAEAVSLLVERPVLAAALEAATARFATDPEGAFAEQQRLLKRKLEFEARLGQIASRKAANAASTDSSPVSAQAEAEQSEMDHS